MKTIREMAYEVARGYLSCNLSLVDERLEKGLVDGDSLMIGSGKLQIRNGVVWMLINGISAEVPEKDQAEARKNMLATIAGMAGVRATGTIGAKIVS